MCGICGVVRAGRSPNENLALVADLNARQRHRGPDSADTCSAGDVAIGQARLALVDLTNAGRQPFVSPDGTIAVVFNGEIYNHQELRGRHRLGASGRCDGAILPELWSRLGVEMFRELRGMYATAVVDRRRHTLTLARDPFRVKPLRWTTAADGAIVFASEIRPLLAFRTTPRIRATALRRYLRFGAVGRLESVSAHLLSDVPVALLLSWGLDSAAIAWACREIDHRLTCVTVDQGGSMGEGDGARRVARRFGHRHEIVTSRPDEESVARYFAAMQRPTIDGLNTFVVSDAIARRGIKVAVSGLGGDEVLGGYPVFRALRRLPLLQVTDRLFLARLLARTVRWRHEKVAELLGPDGPRDAAGLGALSQQILDRDTVDSLAPWASAPAPGPRRGRTDTSALALSHYEIEHYLGATLLPDTDAFSMASSIELRVPYVDVPFARLVLAADRKQGLGKVGFARCLGDSELVAIARRRKQGFTLPMDGWMRHGPLAPLVRSTESPTATVRQILAPGAVDELLHGWRVGRLPWARAWLIVSLEHWLRSVGLDTVRLDEASGGLTLESA
ncbi:asparagine synthetase B [Micromonospora sp. WMMD882]|uniref:asparagine synthetase B family protein n=1 Tax=Micromonospora sp. WMMD882 TaxID=3015151 RepID=UPI00248B5690|nr:asparagine synthetase B [Micromonospora sp. WMMD882]WBB81581.1 asparagine synthetase B [Micromonospora sp. WMMD882]